VDFATVQAALATLKIVTDIDIDMA